MALVIYPKSYVACLYLCANCDYVITKIYKLIRLQRKFKYQFYIKQLIVFICPKQTQLQFKSNKNDFTHLAHSVDAL